MLKIILFLTGALFLLLGGILFFQTPDSSKITQRTLEKEPTTINGYIIKDDFNMKRSLSKVISPCFEEVHDSIEACATILLYSYLKDSFLLDNNSKSQKPNPRIAYKNRVGSYLDLTLLYSSFLVNSGIPSYVKLVDGKVFAYACGITDIEMFNEIKNSLKKSPLSHKEITLQNKRIWAVDLSRKEDKRHLAIDIEAIASKPFDMILFPNRIEMQAHRDGQHARYIIECSMRGVEEVKLTCSAPNGSFLFFQSLGDSNKLKVNISRGGILLEDIKSEHSKQGNNCIRVDINNNSPFQFPGIASY